MNYPLFFRCGIDVRAGPALGKSGAFFYSTTNGPLVTFLLQSWKRFKPQGTPGYVGQNNGNLWLCWNTHEQDVYTQTMKIPFQKYLHIGVRSCICTGNPVYLEKKRRYVNRRGFHHVIGPTPDKISIDRVQLGHPKKFQRFRDNSLSQPGSPKRRGGVPGA